MEYDKYIYLYVGQTINEFASYLFHLPICSNRLSVLSFMVRSLLILKTLGQLFREFAGERSSYIIRYKARAKCVKHEQLHRWRKICGCESIVAITLFLASLTSSGAF